MWPNWNILCDSNHATMLNNSNIFDCHWLCIAIPIIVYLFFARFLTFCIPKRRELTRPRIYIIIVPCESIGNCEWEREKAAVAKLKCPCILIISSESTLSTAKWLSNAFHVNCIDANKSKTVKQLQTTYRKTTNVCNKSSKKNRHVVVFYLLVFNEFVFFLFSFYISPNRLIGLGI